MAPTYRVGVRSRSLFGGPVGATLLGTSKKAIQGFWANHLRQRRLCGWKRRLDGHRSCIMAPMTEGSDKIGSALRFLASGGWADEDPDVALELLRQAHQLADRVIADDGAAPATREAAQAFLEQLQSDTFTQP